MTDTYGLIFDVDGVIADTEAVNRVVSIRVFADLFGIRGVRAEDFEAGLGRGAEEYIKAAAAVHGTNLSPAQVAEATRLRQRYFLESLRENPIPAYPGVLKLVHAALGDKAFRTAIATSGTREKSQAVLDSVRFPCDRMVYVTGSDAKNKKPHPELYVTAATRLGIPPDRCAVIEDAPSGIQAAHAAGCRCIAVTNTASREKLSEADLIVDSLENVTLGMISRLVTATGSG